MESNLAVQRKTLIFTQHGATMLGTAFFYNFETLLSVRRFRVIQANCNGAQVNHYCFLVCHKLGAAMQGQSVHNEHITNIITVMNRELGGVGFKSMDVPPIWQLSAFQSLSDLTFEFLYGDGTTHATGEFTIAVEFEMYD